MRSGLNGGGVTCFVKVFDGLVLEIWVAVNADLIGIVVTFACLRLDFVLALLKSLFLRRDYVSLLRAWREASVDIQIIFKL